MAPKPIPRCRKCSKDTVVWADAGVLKSIPYLCCRNCKIEVTELGYPVPIKGKDTTELDEYLLEKMLDNGLQGTDSSDDMDDCDDLYPYFLGRD